MPDAFISYSRSDARDFVVRLRAALEERGKEPWVDLEEIPPASLWESELRAAIAKSDSFVFVISPGSASSEHCRRELDEALRLNKRILPLNLAAVTNGELPEAISTHNWIPAQGGFTDDFDASLASLIEAAETDLDWVRAHTKWGGLAEAWEEQGKERSLLLRGSELQAAERWISAQVGKEPAPTQLQNDFIVASRQASARRQRLTLIAVGSALLVSALLAIFAVVQRNEAVEQRNEARSRELAIAADTNLRNDPELSLLLAIEAAEASPTQQANEALREALAESRVRTTLPISPWSLDAELSPDGRSVVTAGQDGVARIWNAASGEQTATLRGHTDHVRSVAFSPDGDSVITGSRDGTARIWDAASGEQIRVLPTGGPVWTVAYSPDGESVAADTRTGKGGVALIWDVASGRRTTVLRGHTLGLDSVSFSPDGRRLLTASDDRTARVWDSVTGEQTLVLRHPGEVWSAEFSADGESIVTSSNAVARIWDARSGERVAALDLPNAGVVSFSPDGKSIVAGLTDQTARIWDLATADQTVVLRGHGGWLYSADYSSDGDSVVTSSDDGTVRVWNVASGEPLSTMPTHGLYLNSADFSPDGKSMATAATTTGSGGTARIWNAASGEQTAVLRDRSGAVFSVDYSPGGDSVVTASNEGTVRVWDLASGAREAGGRVGDQPRGLEILHSVQFSPDGDSVATAGEDGRARIWDVATGDQTAVWPAHAGGALGVAFSPDGDSLVSVGRDGMARVWDIATKQQNAVMRGHTGDVFWAEFSPDGEFVVTGGGDGTARVWDAETGEPAALIHGHNGPVYSASFSPDGEFIITAGDDKTVRVWDLATGVQTALVQDHRGSLSEAEFSPDGESVVTASHYEGARVYRCDLCFASLDDALALAQGRVTRELTAEERARYLPE